MLFDVDFGKVDGSGWLIHVRLFEQVLKFVSGRRKLNENRVMESIKSTTTSLFDFENFFECHCSQNFFIENDMADNVSNLRQQKGKGLFIQ